MNADQLRKESESLVFGGMSRRECRKLLLEAANEIERQQATRWSLQCDNDRLMEENKRLSKRLLGLRKRVAEIDRKEMEAACK